MDLPAPWLIALVLVGIALAAIPTRRLSDAGLRPAWLTAYLVLVTGLAVAVVVVRGPARFLVPFLVVLYVAPLVVAPETTARWLRRGRRPPKPVGSGPGRDVGAADPDRASGPGRDVGAADPDRASGPGRDVGAADPDHASADDGEPGPGGPPALPPG